MEYTQGVTTESDSTRHAIEVGGDSSHAVCGRAVTDLGEQWPPDGNEACADCTEALQKLLVAPEN